MPKRSSKVRDRETRSPASETPTLPETFIDKQIFVRAIGPSLTPFGVPNALADPTLELRDINGMLIDSNDDWMNSPQKTQIQNSGLAPTNPRESAVVQTLTAGNYTAIVRGANGGTGVGSVEIYLLP